MKNILKNKIELNVQQNKNRKLTKEQFDALLKVIDFTELMEITSSDREYEHENFYRAAIKYGIVKGEDNGK